MDKANLKLTAINGYGFDHEIQNLKGEQVARVHGGQKGDWWKLTKIMAAAPDLLKAAKRLMDFVDNDGLVKVDNRVICDILGEFSAAIHRQRNERAIRRHGK